jgi:hypothetical protein
LAVGSSERQYKKCPRCGLDKWLDTDFGLVYDKRSGRWHPDAYCNTCSPPIKRIATLRARKQNPERYNEYMREYQRENKGPKTARSRTLSDL